MNGWQDDVNVIEVVVAVVAAHTGLSLPAEPLVIATCLLLDDTVYSLDSDRAVARVCAEHVLEHVGKHVPTLRGIDAIDPDELATALCGVPEPRAARRPPTLRVIRS